MNAISQRTLDLVTDHIDPLTGEVNMTSLAEDVYNELDGSDRDIPEEYFEAAFEAAQYYADSLAP